LRPLAVGSTVWGAKLGGCGTEPAPMAVDPSESTPTTGVTGGTAAGWSDRFEHGLHPAIERFNASIGFDIELLQQDLDGSIAHARMLGHCGVISSEEAERLVGGLETIRAEAAAGQFTPGVEAEDVHFAVERRLIDLLGSLGKKLHTGRSRNDQVGTDLRLWLRGKIDGIDAAHGADSPLHGCRVFDQPIEEVFVEGKLATCRGDGPDIKRGVHLSTPGNGADGATEFRLGSAQFLRQPQAHLEIAVIDAPDFPGEKPGRCRPLDARKTRHAPQHRSSSPGYRTGE